MKINKEQLSKFYKTFMLIIITVLVTFSVTSILLYRSGRIQYIPVSKGDTTGLGTTLTAFKNLLDERFLYDTDDNTMAEAAIKAYIEAAGDEYTEYFTKEEMESFTTYTTGNYVGIGIYMQADLENNKIIVTQPIKNSPAEQAGIKTGDIILKVDGVSYNAEQLSEMSSKIKGKEGTTVDLEIQRGDKTINYTIERKSVELYVIEGEILENNIGYIPLTTFDDGCAEQFKSVYNELKDKKITSLIIDLRDNGGGIVDEAIEIAECILEKDSTVLITVDKNQNEEIEKTKENPVINMPIIVLVNENTASASEILTGALQDYKKAEVVGVTTYGKGVIQELYTLSDGSGLKITIKEYYTPNRKKIHKVGITPDYEIKDDSTTEDMQLKKAIELLKQVGDNVSL